MADQALSIQKHFASLRDPRRHRQRHLLLDIVVIALCAVIAGANNWQQIALFGRHRKGWLKRFLALPNGAPSHDTFERVFARLSPVAFQRCFLSWLRALHAGLGGEHFALDGKTLRRSGSPANGLGPLHVVSVWATRARLTFGQVAVGQESNEITAIPKLLERLDLRGALVSIDAMGCQKEVARQVVEAGGDYLLVVKDNQEGCWTTSWGAWCGRGTGTSGGSPTTPTRRRGAGTAGRRSGTTRCSTTRRASATGPSGRS
jgi:DDE_Tnp_1-associated/Transposase DDE domain